MFSLFIQTDMRIPPTTNLLRRETPVQSKHKQVSLSKERHCPYIGRQVSFVTVSMINLKENVQCMFS